MGAMESGGTFKRRHIMGTATSEMPVNSGLARGTSDDKTNDPTGKILSRGKSRCYSGVIDGKTNILDVIDHAIISWGHCFMIPRSK